MKHRFFCLLVALSLTVTPSAFGKNPQRGISVVSDAGLWGNYHALIIGIDEYKEWPRLKTAVKDASVIRDILVSRYGFDQKNVILRTNENASRLRIIRDLRYLAKSMRKNDNLFIYYAGHGQLDDFTGDGYWVPAEGTLKDPGTWVANSYIKAVLSSEKLQAKNVVIIADSCYSGAMLRGGPSLMSLDDRRYREKLAAKASLRSRQVISSGGVEPVADGGAEGHSLFAYYLIDALRNNDREVIDLENLFHTRVWKPVTEIGNQRPNVGRLKTPMDQEGQFVLYNVALARAQSKTKLRQSVAGKDNNAMPTGSAAGPAPVNLNAEEELWEIVKTSTSMEDFTLFLEAYPHSRFSVHARLKLQQLKRKLNARRMTAAVAPAVVKPAAESAASGAGVAAGDGHYIKRSNGVVYDKKTGLEWYAGPDEDTSWNQTDKWVKNLEVNGGGWRIPRIRELKTLYNKGAGRRNMTALLKTKGTYVWSIDQGDSSVAYYKRAFSFKTGGKVEFYASNASFIRGFAVRSRKDVARVKPGAKKQKVLLASVAPAVVDKTSSNGRKAAGDRYKLALFPAKVLADWSGMDIKFHRAIVRTIAAMSENDDRLDFALSYKRVKGLPDSVRLFSDNADKNKNNVWIKKTIFSQYEPDWAQMKKIGREIDTDLAVLILLQHGSGAKLDVYLYDYKHEKAYSRTGQTISFNDVPGGIRLHVHHVLKDFFNHQ